MNALPDLSNPELSRAILIGTSSFERLPDLPAVRNDLTELAAALTDRRFGILKPENCAIVDSPETPASFLRRLRAVSRLTEDLLLVYYAGHGVRHQTRDLLYLAVEDTDPDEPDGSAVRFDSVREIIEESPARKRLLILDCCYSGMALGAMSGTTIDRRDIVVDGTAVMTSAPKNRSSYSPPGDQLTAFSGELISLLNKGTPFLGEPLTVVTAFQSLQAAMARRQLPMPMLSNTSSSSQILLRRTPPQPEPQLPTAARTAAPEQSEVAQPQPDTGVERIEPAAPPAGPTPGDPVPEPVTPASPPHELTVPAVLVSAEPEPVSVDHSSRVFSVAWGLFGRFVLWLCGGLAFAFGVGGVAGLIAVAAAHQRMYGSDLGAGIGGLVVAASVGFVLHMRYLRDRRLARKRPALSDLDSPPAIVVAKVLLWLTMLFFIGAFVSSLAGGIRSTGAPGDLSPVGTLVYVSFAFAETVVACAYRLYRVSRDRRSMPHGIPLRS